MKRNRDFACPSETGELQKLVRYLFMQRGNISRNFDGLIANSIIEKLNHLSRLILKEASVLNFVKKNDIIYANKIDRIDKKDM